MKKILMAIILLCTFLVLNNTSHSYGKHDNLKKYTYINNINEKDIKIKITNTDTINSTINLDEIYETYSIITLDVVNRGLDSIELSNIDYSFYQNNNKLKTFIQSEDECLGFVGTIDSGEEKKIKIGVVLEEKNTPIKLVFKSLNHINR